MTVLAALLPSIGVTVLFVLGIRALVQADRRERAGRSAVESRGPATDRGGAGDGDGSREAESEDPGAGTSGPAAGGEIVAGD